jgi:hypothetical protein
MAQGDGHREARPTSTFGPRRATERCQSFSDHKLDITVDIYELEEMIAAKERDDLGKIGISVTSSRSGKLQLEVTRVAAYSTRTSKTENS